MTGFSSPLLIAAFVAAGVATWIAGVYLSRTTDALDRQLKLGEALGGMILLAIAGTLPEIAITVSAAVAGRLDIAAGNLIGGIAVQTAVLVICDFAVEGDKPLSYLVGSLIPVLESALVIGVTALVMLGALLPPWVAFKGVSPVSVLIVVVWLGAMAVLNRVRNNPAWEVTMPGSSPGRPHRRIPHPRVVHPYAKWPLWRVALLFAAGSLVTLVAGVVLLESGSVLADRAGINGVIFGATVLAAVSALPEISTGIAAIRLGDNQLAMSDIFGGNAFQVCLFVVADLVAGKPVLPQAGVANSWLAGIGIVMTTVYAMSVVVRPKRLYARVGADSWAVLAVFAIGIAGLTVVAR